MRFLPLTVAVERFPAAIFGLAVVGFLTAAAWRLTGSRVITLGTLALTALTPWLVIESRVGFETISMVALLVGGALVPRRRARPTPRQFGIAGVFLAFAIYGYTTARLEILLIAIVAGDRLGHRADVRLVAGDSSRSSPDTCVLGVYALLNPGALTGRFALISIWADGAPLSVVIDRFLVNYFSYFSAELPVPPRVTRIPRQNTEIGGMLLWVMAPLLIAGMLVCWQRRRRAARAIPRRGASCWRRSPPRSPTTGRRTRCDRRGCSRSSSCWRCSAPTASARLVGGPARARLASWPACSRPACSPRAALFTVDLYAAYPNRAATIFDTGEIAAITTARADRRRAPGLPVGATSIQPYIEAFFALPAAAAARSR